MTEHPFHPDDIDEQIDQLSSSSQHRAVSTDERLLHDMQLLLNAGDINEQRQKDQTSIQRVWTTITAKDIHVQAMHNNRHTLERFTLMSTPSSQPKRSTSWGRRLGLLSVAAIVMVLLGSALAVFTSSQHDRQPNTTTAIPRAGTTVYTYHQPGYGIYGLQWTPDGKRIISTNNNVAGWDAMNGAHVIKYTNFPNDATDISKVKIILSQLSPNGKLLAIWRIRTIDLYDAITGKLLKTFTYNFHYASERDDRFEPYMGWSADSKSFKAFVRLKGTFDDISDKTNLVTYDVASGKMQQEQRLNEQGVLGGIGWSPDGRYIAAGLSNSDSVEVFDSTTGKIVSRHPGQYVFGKVIDPSWSPDSKRIVARLQDGIHIWEAVTGKQIAVYKNGWNPVWSPNGKYIAVVSGDVDAPNDINILDAANGKTLYTYKEHRSVVSVLAWSPDSVYIASGEGILNSSGGILSKTGIVRVWVVRP